MKLKNKIVIIILTLITLINSSICIRPSQAINSQSYIHTSTQAQIENQNTNVEVSANYQTLSINSEAAILIDSKTGKVLYGKNETQKMYPASTTKILTAIIALEKCNLTDKVTASYNAIMSIPSGYSNASIQENEILTVEELLNVFLIHSANEAGYILAEHISGNITNFANLMNQKASEIGCKNTHFTNPSGIHDAEHYSTTFDMALITQYCMKNETFREIVSKTSCTVEPTNKSEKRYYKNTNDLLASSNTYYYKYAIGVKTGYTSQAKRCLIAASSKDNLELITVTLGAPQATQDVRYLDTINLFDFGFSNYKMQEIAKQSDTITEITIEGATKETKVLPIVIKNSIDSIVPTDFNLENLDRKIELNENLVAPIAEGSIVGKVTYNIDGIEYSSDLIASHNVEKSDLLLLIAQTLLAIFVLFILSKLLSSKGKNKKKKSKSKKRPDKIYKFN